MAHPEMASEPNDRLLVALLGIKSLVVTYDDMGAYLKELDGDRRPSAVSVTIDQYGEARDGRELTPGETEVARQWAAQKTGCPVRFVATVESA